MGICSIKKGEKMKNKEEDLSKLHHSLHILDFVLDVPIVDKEENIVKVILVANVFNTNRYDKIREVFKQYNYIINEFKIRTEKSYLYIEIIAKLKVDIQPDIKIINDRA